MPRLRRADCAEPGISRRRRGKGFEYVRPDGSRISDGEVVERIRELAIPPAWTDVWICPDRWGHIQATGVDARGRKQYRYHAKWRERRDREKFDAMTEFAERLPQLRERVERDLRRRLISKERVLACAVRLLDSGFFRIGGEGYAEENNTYGLATIKKSHVTVAKDVVAFDYEAKGGARRVQTVGDPAVARLVRALLARRGGGDELLAYKEGPRWTDIRSDDINAYIKRWCGEAHSAKDFRTWNATVLVAVLLAAAAREDPPESSAARRRVERRVIKQVAAHLGNTPAVCRSSYIDPRVFDRFDGGLTIRPVLKRVPDSRSEWPDFRGEIENAVLDLLAKRETASVDQLE